MTYKRTKPTVYTVYWPAINVFKVGFSEHQRWRTFVNFGAQILDLEEFDTTTDGYAYEDACHMVLWPICRPGFDTAAEAMPYLAGQGGGYVECFKVPGDLMPGEIIPFIDSQLEVFCARA